MATEVTEFTEDFGAIENATLQRQACTNMSPDAVMFAIGGVLMALCILVIVVTQKKEKEQQRRYAEYIQLVDRAHETNLKGNELLEETNRLFHELINEVRHREMGPLVRDPSPQPSPPSDAGIENYAARRGEGEE